MAKRDPLHLDGEGVKKYDRLRKYLGLVYLYGCFNAETLGALNDHSVKDYYAVRELLRDLFHLDEESANPSGAHSFARKYDASARNHMADSYMMYSMDRVSTLLMYLALLQQLQVREASVAELGDDLARMPYVQGDVNQNARNYIKEMQLYGYLEELPKHRYKLKDNVFTQLTEAQLQELYTYVCFAASITYPRVPGSFLRRTLERELRSRGIKISEDCAFLLRNNSNHNVFDEEVVFRLLHLIQRRQGLWIDGREYFPVKLRVDCRLGRWYVLMAGQYHGKMQPVIRAVSRMELPTPSGTEMDPRWEEAASVVAEAYPEEESLFSGVQRVQSVLVEAKLHFEDDKGRQDQFCRELRIGSVEALEDGLYYRAYIRDPLELLPLLRSYAPWLEVLPGDHDLRELMASTLRQMEQNLDQDSWPAQPKNRRTFEKRNSGEMDSVPKESGKNSKERKLFNPFQGRLLQFCLELLADPDGMNTKGISALAKRYGILEYAKTVAVLKEAGFLVPGTVRPRLPMSFVEEEYLQFILDSRCMPEVELFLSEQTRNILKDSLPEWVGQIQWKRASGMELPRYPGHAGFQNLICAIRERQRVTYCYRVRGKQGLQRTSAFPWKIEYSAYDRRWWVILYSEEEKRTIKAPLNHLQDVILLPQSGVSEQMIHEAMDQLRMEKPVELHIRDEHNALQRCFAVFENQEILSSDYSPEAGYILRLNAFRFDREEILRQLMYLGPNVHLEAPEDLRNELRGRLNQAQSYYSAL